MRLSRLSTVGKHNKTCLGRCLFLILLGCLGTAGAQRPIEPTKPALAPKTRILGFLLTGIPRGREIPSRADRSSQQAESPALPGGEYPYRPEFGTEPRPGTDYQDYYAPDRHQVDPARRPNTVEIKTRPVAALMIRNESGKTIKSVEWEFTYPDVKKGKEVIYCPAVSRLRIPPNETTVLVKPFPKDKCELRSEMVNGVPYLRRVCKGKTTGSYPLQTRINRVRYTDGTVEEQTDWRVAIQEVGRPSIFEPGSPPFAICLPGGGW